MKPRDQRGHFAGGEPRFLVNRDGVFESDDLIVFKQVPVDVEQVGVEVGLRVSGHTRAGNEFHRSTDIVRVASKLRGRLGNAHFAAVHDERHQGEKEHQVLTRLTHLRISHVATSPHPVARPSSLEAVGGQSP